MYVCPGFTSARLQFSSSLEEVCRGMLDINAEACVAVPAAAASVVMDECWFEIHLTSCKVKMCTNRKPMHVA